jgi:hypothetical protein
MMLQTNRRWDRSVSELGDKAREDTLQKELETRCPQAEYPFNIEVFGVWGTGDVTVRIWRSEPHMEYKGTARPRDFIHAETGETRAAILDTLANLIERTTVKV